MGEHRELQADSGQQGFETPPHKPGPPTGLREGLARAQEREGQVSPTRTAPGRAGRTCCGRSSRGDPCRRGAPQLHSRLFETDLQTKICNVTEKNLKYSMNQMSF